MGRIHIYQQIKPIKELDKWEDSHSVAFNGIQTLDGKIVIPLFNC